MCGQIVSFDTVRYIFHDNIYSTYIYIHISDHIIYKGLHIHVQKEKTIRANKNSYIYTLMTYITIFIKTGRNLCH